jgi:hypothetical protein
VRSLELADSAGTPLRTLVAPNEVYDLGQPFFSADGQWVYLAVLESPVASLWDLIVPSAVAHSSHDSAADWWRVSLDGTTLEQVSALSTVVYDGGALPSGGLVAATGDGVVIIDPDSGTATTALTTRTVRAVACK